MKSLFQVSENNYAILTEGLSHEVQRLLLFCAYKVSVISDSDTQRYAKYYGYQKKEVMKLFRILESKGLIYNPYYNYWYPDRELKPEYFLTIAFHLLLKEAELLSEFRQFKMVRQSSDEFLWTLAKELTDGRPDAGREARLKGDWPEDCPRYLSFYFQREEFENLLYSLPEKYFNELIESRIDDIFHFASTSETELSRLEYLITEYYKGGLFGRLPMSDLLLDHLSLLRYFYDGEPFRDETEGQSMYFYAYEAITSLYHGYVDPALEYFQKALKIRNKGAKDKNVFKNPLLCFLLILTYKKANTDETRTKVSQFLNKKILEENYDLRPAAVLAECVGTAMEEKQISDHLHYLAKSLRSPICVYLSSMLYEYFGFSIQKEIGIDAGITEPCFAILRHELSPWLENISEDEAAQLKTLYGGAPVLSSIVSVEKWELVLEQMRDMLQRQAGNDAQPVPSLSSERIGYFLKSDNFVSFRLQKRLKSGEWSAGKQVSLYDFYYAKLDCMDEADRKIASASGRQYDHSISVRTAFPFLIGTDKVYTGNYAPYIPVSISEEKPYIEIKQVKGNFAISSNALNTNLHNEPFLEKVAVRKIDKTHYSVINLTDMQKQLLTSLISLSRLPQKSEEVLRQILPLLSKHIEVHSELLDGGSSLESKEGDAVISIQVTPSDAEYYVCVFVRPLPDGRETFTPGKGDKTIYDEANGVRYQVVRDLKQERANAALLSEFVEDAFESDIFEYSEMVMSTEELLELIEWVTEHQDAFAMEWPQGKKVKVHPQVTQSGVSVSVVSRENWFEMEGEVRYGDDVINLEALLALIASGQMKGRYVRLAEDEYLALTDGLRKQLKRLSAISETSKNQSLISAFNIGPLAELVKGGNVNTDNGVEALMAKVVESSSLEPDIPSSLNAILRDYQYEGFRWMVRLDHWGAGACLADDMGLGKTVQTIAFLLYKASQGPSLVVAPASVVLNWSRELERFAPSMNVKVLNHSADRGELLASAGAYDVVLTTYGILPQEEERLIKVHWNVICLDEAHTIKNRQTKMSASAMRLKASSRVILTGTPIQNYLGELWNLFQFLNPGLLGSFEQFSRKYISSEDADLVSLKKILQPFILRRTKAQVVDELPDKTDIIYPVELSDPEMMAYESMRERVEQSLGQESKINVNALAEITKLRQAACSLSLVNDNWTLPSSKVAAFTELISDILSGDNRVLVFSQFTSYLGLITAALDEIGVEYFYLDGSTPIRKRNKMVQDFQSGQKQIFVVSLKAGGLGLNLTGANYVIHLDPWWNPAVEQQATDRAYRIGQKQNVTVYHLISQHTIEEKILRLHKAKRNLADTFLEGTEIARTLTLDDLKQLVEV